MNLTIRPLLPDDWKWLDKLPTEVRPSKTGVQGKGVYTFVCLQAGKPVGVAVGSIDTGGGDTSHLDFIHVLTGDWNVFVALMQRHAMNGLKLGQKWAMASIPTDDLKQCTNMAGTAALTAGLTLRLGLGWQDSGMDMARAVPAYKKTNPVDMAEFVETAKVWLEKAGCVVEQQ